MASMNLEKMSEKELAKLEKDLTKELQSREKGKRNQARKAIEEAAKKHGFSLNDLVGGRGGSRKKAPQPAKYRNPADPTQTWSGRGRQPAWYKAAIEKGASPKSLEI